jgi:hypothetical protein
MGMIGGLFGGSGGGGGFMPPMPSSQVQQQQQPQMKGPTNVNEILRELHQDAFPGAVQGGNNQRIEIISNASESEISEMPDINELPIPAPKTKRRGTGGKARNTLNI